MEERHTDLEGAAGPGILPVPYKTAGPLQGGEPPRNESLPRRRTLSLDFIPLLSSLTNLVAPEIVDILVRKAAHLPFIGSANIRGGKGSVFSHDAQDGLFSKPFASRGRF